MKNLIAALVILISGYSISQEVPPVPNTFEFSVLTPGLRFPLNGTIPISLAAGSGAQISYLFSPTVVLPGNITANIVGLGAFCLVAVNMNPSTITENLSCGPEVLILDRVSLGFTSDFVSGGTEGLSGLLTGKVSLSNFAPVVFYSVPLSL